MTNRKRLSERVIGCAQNVNRELGAGFLEAVYENALVLKLEHEGIAFKRQHPLDVYYKKQLVGQYQADLVVENKLIVEMKAVRAVFQCLSQSASYKLSSRDRVERRPAIKFWYVTAGYT